MSELSLPMYPLALFVRGKRPFLHCFISPESRVLRATQLRKEKKREKELRKEQKKPNQKKEVREGEKESKENDNKQAAVRVRKSRKDKEL